MEHNSADFAADFIYSSGGASECASNFPNCIHYNRFIGAVYNADFLRADTVHTGRIYRELVGCLERNQKRLPGRLGWAGFNRKRRDKRRNRRCKQRNFSAEQYKDS